MKFLIALFSLTLATTSAHAAWHEASSDNFVIYADANEEDLRVYAENLERYHSAMEQFTGRMVRKPSPSSRITIYALGSASKVRRLAGTGGVVGFYLPRYDGSVAFVQDVKNKEGVPDISTKVLLHEYAHHFLSSTSRFAMPLWMNEGAAEFFSATYFPGDGSIHLGTASSGRDFTIFWIESQMTPVRELLDLDWERLSRRANDKKDSFYGWSWLLYHYLSVNEDRRGQLREYWLEVLKGTPSIDAGKRVFGDLGDLERELKRYARDREWASFHVLPNEMNISPVSIRPLNEGEVAMMDVRIQTERGLTAPQAAKLVKLARPIAEAHPESADAQTTLAMAEYAATNYEAAIAAADRALALDSSQTDAYVHKGMAEFRLARAVAEGPERDAAYERAMQPFRSLAALENNHPAPMVYAYRSYAERGVTPSDDAKRAFIKAAELAPFERELWLLVGMMHMNEGRITDARAALAPLASAPHGYEKAGQVRRLLAYLADKEEGKAVPVQQAISAYFLAD